MITIHPNMTEKYSSTHFGVLIMDNFRARAETKEEFLRVASKVLNDVRKTHSNYNRKFISEADSTMKHYVEYYKKFKKTYHILLQLESVLNGKDLPDTNPLVQAMFLTEIKTSLLIAGHDLKKCKIPLVIHTSQGGEAYLGSGNRDVIVKPNDICLSDQENLILSIIYGQDEQTRITRDTSNVLFLVDGVPGLDKIDVEEGLKTLLSYVRILDPESILIEMSVISLEY